MVLQNRKNLKLGQASKGPGGRTKGACMYSRKALTANSHRGGKMGGEGKLETAELGKGVWVA